MFYMKANDIHHCCKHDHETKLWYYALAFSHNKQHRFIVAHTITVM